MFWRALEGNSVGNTAKTHSQIRRSGSGLRPSSPFPGQSEPPESGYSFRLLICCLTELDGWLRIRLRAAGDLRTRYGMVLLARCWGDRRRKSLGSCRRSRVAGFSVAFCWGAGPSAGRHNFRMLIPRAGRRCSSCYSRYGVITPSIHFMNARTRRDRLLRCATTRDTGSARRRKSGMISTSAPLPKYWPIPRSGA
jgi:hypothetical protein